MSSSKRRYKAKTLTNAVAGEGAAALRFSSSHESRLRSVSMFMLASTSRTGRAVWTSSTVRKRRRIMRISISGKERTSRWRIGSLTINRTGPISRMLLEEATPAEAMLIQLQLKCGCETRRKELELILIQLTKVPLLLLLTSTESTLAIVKETKRLQQKELIRSSLTFKRWRIVVVRTTWMRA